MIPPKWFCVLQCPKDGPSCEIPNMGHEFLCKLSIFSSKATLRLSWMKAQGRFIGVVRFQKILFQIEQGRRRRAAVIPAIGFEALDASGASMASAASVLWFFSKQRPPD